jgi:transcriptional regulator with XRE-family HTH domain
MAVSLLSFAFDKAAVGSVLKEWIADAGYTNTQVARMAGMTDDMLSNVLCGRNKEVSLDRITKICVITNHTIEELILRATDGIDTDFAMPLSVRIADAPYPADPSAKISGKTVNMEATGMMPSEFNRYVQHMDAHNEKMLDRFKAVHAEARKNMDDQYRASIARYETQIGIIISEHKKSTEDLKESHSATVRLLTHHLKRLRCIAWVLLIVLAVLFVIDFVLPHMGVHNGTIFSFFKDIFS